MTDTASTTRYELVADTTGPVSHESPIALVRRVLRGRILFTICVVGLFGAIGGVLGYSAVRPRYESTGLLSFKSALPTLLYDTNAESTTDFASFVATQLEYLRSSELLEQVVQHPDLRALDWPTDAHGIARLRSMIDIRRERGTQVVHVVGTHTEPFMAETVVNAVLETYSKLGVDPTLATLRAREASLARRTTDVQDQLAGVQTEILERSGQYGEEGLAAIHASKVTELIEVESKLAELRLTAARLASGEIPDEDTMAIMSPVDDGFARMAAREQRLLEELRGYEGRFGPAHPIIRRLNEQLDAVRTQMTVARSADGATAASPIEATKLRIAALISQHEELRAALETEVTELGQRRADVAMLATRESDLERQLSAARQHLDAARMELAREDRDRVAVAAWGDFPIAPATDRRAGLAAAGMLLAACGGFAFVILLGVADPRARYVEDLGIIHESPIVLGALPELDRRPITRARANRTVHQLRNLLEIKTADPDRNVYAITSASGGEGRTSLALGLAASFAAAERRTLLIDADLTAGGVTSEMGLQNAPGVCEAIGPEGMTGRVHATRRANLWVMPSGITGGMDARDLSHSKLEVLLDALRDRFDAIVIDTGAIRTSVEAGLVTSLANQTVLVVEREQRLTIVENALARLWQTGATITGLIFNRALAGDFRDEATAVRHERRPSRRRTPARLMGESTIHVGDDTGRGALAATIGAVGTGEVERDLTVDPDTRRHAA